MGGKKNKDQPFTFDRVFDDNTTQAEVYEATTKNLLDSVLDGYNATVFAYGATGCGKTHTITYVQEQKCAGIGTDTALQWHGAITRNYFSDHARDV